MQTLPLKNPESAMAEAEEHGLPAAIKRAAEVIPFEQMMIGAADHARLLAHEYRDLGVSEIQILAALVAHVQKRRDASGI